jgi:hypothetical protein
VQKIEQYAPKYVDRPFRTPDQPGLMDGPWIVDHPEMPDPQGPTMARRFFNKLRG